MASDIDAARDPHLLVAEHIVEEALQRLEASRPANDARVKRNRHHLWREGPLRIEAVECVLEILEELIARAEATSRRLELHIGGIRRVRHDEMRASVVVGPIGQVVGIGIGIVEKSALLNTEPPRVLAAAPLIEAQWPFAQQAFMDCDRPADVLELLLG
jgi:hypothetical protein